MVCVCVCVPQVAPLRAEDRPSLRQTAVIERANSSSVQGGAVIFGSSRVIFSAGWGGGGGLGLNRWEMVRRQAVEAKERMKRENGPDWRL